MIPIIQFDPATMALIYDVQLISSSDRTGGIATAVSAVVAGDSAAAFETLGSIEDDATKDRALQITSALWHEKRHFLDFVMSNYGSFRFRQFLDVYANMPAILHSARDYGKLHVPLEIYADPVRRAVMGVTEIPPDYEQLGRILRSRRKAIERDRARLESRFGGMEIGGEAQFECLAFMAQLAFVQIFTGVEGLQRFFGSLFDWEQFSHKYLSLLTLSARIGVLPASALEAKGVMQFDTTLLECILFASLQTDHVPNRPLDGLVQTSYPGERFAAICVDLVQSRNDLCTAAIGTLDFDECWRAVDEACERQFGMSVLDQMQTDNDYLRAHLNAIRGRIPDEIETMISDYVDLRAQLHAEFEKDPELFISARRFTLELADRLDPNYVIVASGGVVGAPPAGYEQLMGFAQDGADFKKAPYRKWWWACSPDAGLREARLRTASGTPILRLRHTRAWYTSMDFYAPISKLLMNGRRLRTLIGPELLFAQQRLKDLFNIDISIYPSFEFPDEEFSVKILYYYYGQKVLKCDVSSKQLDWPAGHALYPWTLRRWPKLAEYLIKNFGEHELGYYTFIRDWSPWVVSNEVFDQLRPLMEA